MLNLDRETRLPLSRAFLVGCALVLGSSVATTRAGAEQSEATTARLELDATLGRMESTARVVRDMLRDARKRSAKRETGCLDEALSRVHAARRAASNEAEASLSAYAVDDLEAARALRARVGEREAMQRLALRDGLACRPAETSVRVIPPR